jgi:hypothetical protein
MWGTWGIPARWLSERSGGFGGRAAEGLFGVTAREASGDRKRPHDEPGLIWAGDAIAHQRKEARRYLFKKILSYNVELYVPRCAECGGLAGLDSAHSDK